MLHPLQEQRDSVRDWRQIGLGTLGLGDMLIKLGVKYGSPESLKVIQEVYQNIAYKAIATSLELAKEKGAFPKCDEKTKEPLYTQILSRVWICPIRYWKKSNNMASTTLSF